MTRSIARVKQNVNPTAHLEGAPPGVLGTDEQTALPDAAWVVMEMKAEGVFLIRYSEAGEFAGDTWTPTRELALEVAADEYGLVESDWIDVPDGARDPLAYAAGLIG
jgi:hypothetical protein